MWNDDGFVVNLVCGDMKGVNVGCFLPSPTVDVGIRTPDPTLLVPIASVAG